MNVIDTVDYIQELCGQRERVNLLLVYYGCPFTSIVNRLCTKKIPNAIYKRRLLGNAIRQKGINLYYYNFPLRLTRYRDWAGFYNDGQNSKYRPGIHMNTVLSPGNSLSYLIHEATHALNQHRGQSFRNEFVATSVQYIIMKELGVDYSDFFVDYLVTWGVGMSIPISESFVKTSVCEEIDYASSFIASALKSNK